MTAADRVLRVPHVPETSIAWRTNDDQLYSTPGLQGESKRLRTRDAQGDGSDHTWEGVGTSAMTAWNPPEIDAPKTLPQDMTAAYLNGPVIGRSWQMAERPRPKMRTGCVSCLVKGIPCDPQNPECQLGLSDDWHVNADDGFSGNFSPAQETPYSDGTMSSLTLMRVDTKWRRSWRERHSLNFFVNFSAPQMAGFFDSSFWQRSVIQLSYTEPAVLHAITAMGSLHEAILQRSSVDERKKAQNIAFALGQCNKAIGCLTTTRSNIQGGAANPRLALTTCVLFTCFEAMQGHCDSAVNHALQGRRLLQAFDRNGDSCLSAEDAKQIETMRPLVERLEVQATALLDRSKRPDMEDLLQSRTLPVVEIIFSLDHAHNTLHMALNHVTRFMQGFDPSAPRVAIEAFMVTKCMRYGPWFHQWEMAFTAFLTSQRSSLTPMDLKRAMVLKANHLVGAMLASVDQSAGPKAYDVYEDEFQVIVDLACEVLVSYSCPPTPALSSGSASASYLSFSLWVTDPLWMAISRCRNPTIRQSAFTLLSQNPRQEGIWHGGPATANNKVTRKPEKRKVSESQTPRARIKGHDNASEKASGAATRGAPSSAPSRSSSKAKRTASKR